MERFWAKVAVTPGCWLWTSALDRDGYGLFQLATRVTVRAHRYAYEQLVGPIPEGLQLDHVKARGCTNRNCVNPDHLEPVTTRVNVLRSEGVAAKNATKGRCPQGHEYGEGNTYTDKRGKRNCRICKAEAARRYRARLQTRRQ